MILLSRLNLLSKKKFGLIRMKFRRENDGFGNTDLKEIDRLVFVENEPLDQQAVLRIDLNVTDVERNDPRNNQRWTLEIGQEKGGQLVSG